MKERTMNQFIANLRREAEANPVAALGVAALLTTAVSKLLDANTQRSYAKIHAREVNRRIMNSTK